MVKAFRNTMMRMGMMLAKNTSGMFMSSRK